MNIYFFKFEEFNVGVCRFFWIRKWLLWELRRGELDGWSKKFKYQALRRLKTHSQARLEYLLVLASQARRQPDLILPVPLLWCSWTLFDVSVRVVRLPYTGGRCPLLASGLPLLGLVSQCNPDAVSSFCSAGFQLHWAHLTRSWHLKIMLFLNSFSDSSNISRLEKFRGITH